MAFGVVDITKDGKKLPTRYYSNKQEKAVAKAVDGRQTVNSGATPFQKGDVFNKEFLIECKTKTTPSDSFIIHKAWLERNMHEAAFMGKEYSALAFNFGPGQQNYYIIDEFLFQDLIEFIKNK